MDSYHKFIHKFYDWNSKQVSHEVEVTTYDVTLTEIIQAFEDYLRGCGFVFDGNLTIINDEIKEAF